MSFILYLHELERHDEAYAVVEKYFADQPKNYEFWKSYAAFLIEILEEYFQALEIYKRLEQDEKFKAKSVLRDAAHLYGYGVCLLNIGFVHEAEEKLIESCKLEQHQCTYQALIDCCIQARTFSRNERFMVSNLFVSDEGTIAKPKKLYWLTHFYLNWQDSLSQAEPRDLEEEKIRAYQAYDYAKKAYEALQEQSSTEIDESAEPDEECSEDVTLSLVYLEGLIRQIHDVIQDLGNDSGAFGPEFAPC